MLILIIDTEYKIRSKNICLYNRSKIYTIDETFESFDKNIKKYIPEYIIERFQNELLVIYNTKNNIKSALKSNDLSIRAIFTVIDQNRCNGDKIYSGRLTKAISYEDYMNNWIGYRYYIYNYNTKNIEKYEGTETIVEPIPIFWGAYRLETEDWNRSITPYDIGTKVKFYFDNNIHIGTIICETHIAYSINNAFEDHLYEVAFDNETLLPVDTYIHHNDIIEIIPSTNYDIVRRIILDPNNKYNYNDKTIEYTKQFLKSKNVLY